MTSQQHEAITAPSVRRAAGGRRVGQFLAHSCYRPTVLGHEHVPTAGPVILASNHSAFLDGPLVFGLTPRPAHFLVKAEAFRGFFGWVLKSSGQIPVQRSGVDRRAMQTALAVLRRGGGVGMFPEGTRGRGDVAAVHQGVTWLAMASGAPVVPVATLGTRSPTGGADRIPRLWRRLAVVFGAPLMLKRQAGMPRQAASALLTEQLRQALAAHVLASAQRTGIDLPEVHDGT
ncbi:MAG: lysophospholipid acyltransferase family protein [Actinomycetota bacterium]